MGEGYGVILGSGGNGSTFNLTVTAYANVGSIPALGAANYTKIAIVSSTAVPTLLSGGVIIKNGNISPATRVNGNALVSGDIWINIGHMSNIPNILVNSFIMNVIGVAQWNGSGWAEVATYVSDNGSAYIEAGVFLYKPGNLCTELTGGWAARAWAFSAAVAGLLPNINSGSQSVTVSYTNQQDKGGAYEIANNIDLTNFSTIRIDASGNGNGTQMFTHLIVGARTAQYNWAGTAFVNLSGARSIKTLDVTALNGSYDIYLSIGAVGIVSPTMTMYSLRIV